MYTKILGNKFNKEVAGKREEVQAAFRTDKQAHDHLSVTRKVTETQNEQEKTVLSFRRFKNHI